MKRRRAAARLLSRTGPSVFQARKARAVRRERDEGENADEARVPVENSDGSACAEVGEERELEPAVGGERNAADQIAERRPEEHGQERAREREEEIPGEAPDGIRDVAPELDRDAPQDETPQDEEDREVEAGYSAGEDSRKRRRRGCRRRPAARLRCRPSTGRWPRGPGGARSLSAPRSGGARRRRGRSRPERRMRSA